MRINLAMDAKRAGFEIPIWFCHLLSDAINKYSIEYQVDPTKIKSNLYDKDSDNLILLEDVLSKVDFKTQTYKLKHLPSWGLIFDENQSIIVEYKLKHS